MLFWEIFSRENLIKMIVTGLPTIIIALIVPFYAIRFALRQYYSQKWWEQKSSAYIAVIEQLAKYKYSCDTLFEHYMGSKESNDGFTSIHFENRSNAFKEIQLMKLKGQFIFPKSVIIELESFTKNVEFREADQNWIGSLDEQSRFAGNCIKQLKEIGLKDLKIK